MATKDYNASEIERATNVYKQRQSQGLDTGAQERYLNKLGVTQINNGVPVGAQAKGSAYYNDGRAQGLNPGSATPDQIKTSPQLLNSEIKRAQDVIAHRQAQGLDISAQTKYLESLGGHYNAQMANPETAMQNNLIASSDAFVQQQSAALELQKEQTLREIESAYNQAVADGEMSVREAEQAFAEQKKAIEQQAYQDAQVTNLTAQNRGIQNSMQMLGLQAGDNARNNSLKSQALTERDARILDIQDRIKQIGLQRNLDISGANTQYSTGMINAQAQANQQLNEQLFNWNSQVYTMDREEKHAFAVMAKQHGYDLEKMDTQQRYQLESLAKQHGYDVALSTLGHTQNKEIIGIEHGNNVAMENLSNANAIGRENLNHSNSLARQKQAQSAQGTEDDGYLTSLERAIAAETEGTPEYNLKQLQQQNAGKQADNEASGEYRRQSYMNALAEGAPTKPKRKDYNSLGDFKKEEDRKYNEALAIYNEKNDLYKEAVAWNKKNK